jgi:putative redox protein
MVEIQIVYEGDLRCKVVHGPSQTELYTDAPVDNHGKGESFSPTDLVATALGTCMATTMGIFAKRHDISLKGMNIRVEKHMTDNPRRIGKLVLHLHFSQKFEEKDRKALEASALACPVHKSLHPDVEKIMQFHYPN